MFKSEGALMQVHLPRHNDTIQFVLIRIDVNEGHRPYELSEYARNTELNYALRFRNISKY